MPGTFPWPRTEAEHLEHLHLQHRVMVGSMTEWRALFGNMRQPSRAHTDMHLLDTATRRPHRHSEWGGRP